MKTRVAARMGLWALLAIACGSDSESGSSTESGGKAAQGGQARGAAGAGPVTAGTSSAAAGPSSLVGGSPWMAGAAGSSSGMAAGGHTGGATTGGSGSGGKSAGGSNPGSAGGPSTGGAANGGASSGGRATGGTGTGGVTIAGSGGRATGGAATGGTGGTTGGGAGGGGRATGGTATGGKATGGGAGTTNCTCFNSGAPVCAPTGSITYALARAASPTAQQLAAYAAITCAMDMAVAYYNCYTVITKSLAVSYDPGVPTAQANYNGSMQFGSTASMNCITAMHEISHTVGIGTQALWAPRLSGGLWTGTSANALLQSITGNAADVVHGDAMHFWPYGLNYTTEVSSTADLVNHCRLVVALRADMGL
jgi:hypothetical protein